MNFSLAILFVWIVGVFSCGDDSCTEELLQGIGKRLIQRAHVRLGILRRLSLHNGPESAYLAQEKLVRLMAETPDETTLMDSLDRVTKKAYAIAFKFTQIYKVIPKNTKRLADEFEAVRFLRRDMMAFLLQTDIHRMSDPSGDAIKPSLRVIALRLSNLFKQLASLLEVADPNSVTVLEREVTAGSKSYKDAQAEMERSMVAVMDVMQRVSSRHERDPLSVSHEFRTANLIADDLQLLLDELRALPIGQSEEDRIQSYITYLASVGAFYLGAL